MDDSTSAWFAARAGFALDTWVDRQLGGGQTLYNSGQTYGQDEFGNVYVLGQPNVTSRVNTSPPVSPLVLMMMAGLVYLLVSK